MAWATAIEISFDTERMRLRLSLGWQLAVERGPVPIRFSG
jgi:hypothetical protein